MGIVVVLKPHIMAKLEKCGLVYYWVTLILLDYTPLNLYYDVNKG